MSEYKANERFRLEQRSAKAAEQQALAAREQSVTAKKSDRKAIWIICGTFLTVVAAIAGPLIAINYEDSFKTQRTYEQQIQTETSIAEQLKATIEDLPSSVGPDAVGGVDHIRSVASQDHDLLIGIDQSERQHELTTDRDALLGDVYVARREVYYRLDRCLKGAVAQAVYRAANPSANTGDTTNYIFGCVNTDIALMYIFMPFSAPALRTISQFRTIFG